MKLLRFVITALLLISSSIPAGALKAKEYWQNQAALIEYNPLFHISGSIGGQIELSWCRGFSTEIEFVYLHTELFTPVSIDTKISEKITGWKLLIEPVVYFLPLVTLFKKRIKRELFYSMMQIPLTGPYFGFGFTIGYFEGYIQTPARSHNFGAGLCGKVGFRVVFLKILSLNLYLGVSGFFNHPLDYYSYLNGAYIKTSANKFYKYTTEPNVHAGLNIGLYIPFKEIIKYYDGRKSWAE